MAGPNFTMIFGVVAGLLVVGGVVWFALRGGEG